jgi:16S rRNA (cytidine1402-2'-O)-methyltransferase
MATEKNKVQGGTLYLVGTPIGNLSDISERAVKVLTEVDFIAAEDTRNSLKLLLALGIKNELISYHEHNRKSSGERILARLLAGESCALVTDAGMPAISDPGEDIVGLCAESGVTVVVVPGPCAAVSALALSGLPTSRFAFEGFLPAVKGERRARLDAVAREERTMIFYEAPHKLCGTLEAMAEVLGSDRRIALCREMTKLNEQTLRMTLGEAIDYYSEREPRGEYVLVLEGYSGGEECKSPCYDDDPEVHVSNYQAKGLSRMDAIKQAARDRGISKSEMYKLVNV